MIRKSLLPISRNSRYLIVPEFLEPVHITNRFDTSHNYAFGLKVSKNHEMQTINVFFYMVTMATQNM